MDFNGLINGNSDDLLPKMIESGIKVDLILTDPPYNLNKDFGNDSDKLPLDEFLKITKSRVANCRDLLTPQGSLIWFGIHHYIGFIQTIMYESGLDYRRMNIWYYENGFSRTKTSPACQYEPFLWFSKSSKKVLKTSYKRFLSKIQVLLVLLDSLIDSNSICKSDLSPTSNISPVI